MLKKFSEKIGFTQTEIKVVLFLAIVFAIGLGVKYVFFKNSVANAKKYDYSIQDSIFQEIEIQDNRLRNEEIAGKAVDYKQEVLDFNSSDFHKKEAKKLPGGKSININTAGIEDLVMLPGIGTKTAQKIIDLRKTKGRFNKLEELYEVKGIGKTRFNKIEKFLYIDH
jgi:competence ComEA-like helix-hairpin-helix protein